jgi:hypothetical protein
MFRQPTFTNGMQFQDVEFRTQLGDGLRRERLHLEALAFRQVQNQRC